MARTETQNGQVEQWLVENEVNVTPLIPNFISPKVFVGVDTIDHNTAIGEQLMISVNSYFAG